MNAGEEEGLINEEENEMIQSSLPWGYRGARNYGAPYDMAYVTVDAPVREVLRSIIACGHSASGL